MQQTALPPPPSAAATARRGVGVARSGQTRQALLDAAERLFAERGVNWVSMREIVRESQQHNTSAALYHFGSREALIVAVVERRQAIVNAMRHQRIDELEASGQGHDLRKVMAAAIEPLAECVRTTDWGARYAQIYSELSQRPADSPEVQWHTGHLSSMLRFETLVQRCLPDLPPSVLQRRLRMLRNHTTYALSGWVRFNGPVTASNSVRFRREVEALIDFMTAGVGAEHHPRPPQA